MALQLEPKARARLAHRILENLDELSPDENARVWAAEAQRRSEAINTGTISSKSADDVFRDARALSCPPRASPRRPPATSPTSSR